MELTGKNAIVLVENMFNDQEFWYPFYRLQEAGAKVLVVAPEQGRTYSGKAGTVVKSHKAASSLNGKDVDIVVIPGGYAPDLMRRDPDMVRLVKEAFESGKVVAAICHAGWMLASAKILAEKKVTSFFAIKDDLIHAGANWVDEQVVVDQNLITSRTPDDLPAFMRNVIQTAK